MDKTGWKGSVCRSLTAAGVVVSLLAPGSNAYAQSSGDSSGAQPGYVNTDGSGGTSGDDRRDGIPGVLGGDRLARELQSIASGDISRSLNAVVRSPRVVSDVRQVAAFPASSSRRHRSTSDKVAGALVGAVGGFLLGSALGAEMQTSPDMGWGIVVGAPAGAVIGGILGAKFLF
jgi:hypothetical protein